MQVRRGCLCQSEGRENNNLWKIYLDWGGEAKMKNSGTSYLTKREEEHLYGGGLFKKAVGEALPGRTESGF